MDRTPGFGFSKMTSSDDRLSDDSFKILGADRDLLDRILTRLIGHDHSPVSGTGTSPTNPPTLTVVATGGTIPAGTRVYYEYTHVDVNGAESLPSPAGFVDTPDPVAEPEAASATLSATGGTLLPGNYSYALSAYVTVNTNETRAPNRVNPIVPVGTTTNRITLLLPSLPAGAAGFNVYRRKPGSTQYFYVTSINMDVATPPTTWIDDGTLPDDCGRTLPQANTTFSTNEVVITLPGATPTVPVGFTWKIYRTFVAGDFRNSFLHQVIEETAEGSGIITPTWTDTGSATSAGQPPDREQFISDPPPVATLHAVEFFFPGPVQLGFAEFVWPSPFPNATVMGAVGSLADGSAPAAQSVQFDVMAGQGHVPSFDSVYDDYAEILVGETVGSYYPADTQSELASGDSITCYVNRGGGGATPTDYNLTIVVYLMAHI